MRRDCLLLLAAAFASLTLSCDERVLVRWTTQVYEDGSLQRRLEVRARDANGATPEGTDWIERGLNLRLADPGAWSHVERAPGHLVADGFFPSALSLPRALAHGTESGLHPDRTRTTVDVEDMVVLRRWTYRESYGDPFGSEEAATALDDLMEMARRFLHEGIRNEFGDGLDTKKADAFLATELRPVAVDLVAAGLFSTNRAQAPIHGWQEVLRQRRIPFNSGDDPSDPQLAFEALLDWSRERLAAGLSTPGRIIHSRDLDFISQDELSSGSAEGYVGKGARIAERLWGSEAGFESLVEGRLEELQGYFNSMGIPSFTFEARLTLPGRLLTTDGTPDAEEILWIFRGEDLRGGDRKMEAVSVSLDDEKLRSLGARRELEPAALLRLANILSRRDLDGRLKASLRGAVARGGLARIRAATGVDDGAEGSKSLRDELADLLDPSVEQP